MKGLAYEGPGSDAEGVEGPWSDAALVLGAESLRVEAFWPGIELGVVVQRVDGRPDDVTGPQQHAAVLGRVREAVRLHTAAVRTSAGTLKGANQTASSNETRHFTLTYSDY